MEEIQTPHSVLWARHSKQLSASVAEEISPLLRGRLPDLEPLAVVQDLARNCSRYDMSRSAARFRRRLYAQWRSPLVLTEFVHLGPEGWGLRALAKDPAEVGDFCLEQFKALAAIRMWGAPGKARLSNQERVVALKGVLNGVLKATKTGQPLMTDVEVAVLWALHANEGGRKVRMETLAPGVSRHLPLWGLQAPKEAELGALVETLKKRGFIKDLEDGNRQWRLQDWVMYPF
jgi:hypothetical protein